MYLARMEFLESFGQRFLHHSFLLGFGCLLFLDEAFGQSLTYCFSLPLYEYPQRINW